MFKVTILMVILMAASSLQAIFDDTQNSTEFTLNLYKYCDVRENVIISPISLRILLSILYSSAYDSSEKELRDILLLSDKQTTKLAQKNTINSLSLSPNLYIVNKLFLKESAQINREFHSSLNEYQASLEKVDFKQKAQVVRNINNWVSEQTRGLITNLITEDVLTNDISLLLLNTIYFKAQWLEAFDKDFVFKNQFIDIDGNEKFINSMSNTGFYRFLSNDRIKADILEIQYSTGSNFVFWIILPNLDSSLSEVQHLLNFKEFNLIDKTMEITNIDIYIPKFEVESLIDGKELLKKIGLRSIFDKYELNILNGNSSLKVDDIRQKTRIIVNTDGTEAATSSYIKAVALSSKPVFQVNRPFIYCVLTTDTKIPVFIGHYSKPNEKK